MGGLDIGIPDEGVGGVSEQAAEEARQRFAAAQAALQQLAAEEKRSKKRDDGVAQAIIQFLTDKQRTHLATLIARIVSLDCPSTFLLALLSLINERCQRAVDEYLREHNVQETGGIGATVALSGTAHLPEEANTALSHWVMRLEGVLSTDQIQIVQSLFVDDSSIDHAVLQLTIFILQEYLASIDKDTSYEQLQPLAATMLQSLFLPALQVIQERAALQQAMEEGEEE